MNKLWHNVLKIITKSMSKSIIFLISLSFLLSFFSSLFLMKQILPKLKTLRGKEPTALKGGIKSKINTISNDEVELILERNIFNKDQKNEIVEQELEEEIERIKKTSLPLRLLGTIDSGTPQTGLALIENKKKKKVHSFLVGEELLKNVTLTEVYQEKVIITNGNIKEYLEVAPFVIPKGRKVVEKKETTSGFALEAFADSYKEEGFERKNNDIVMSEDYRQKLLTTDFAKLLQEARAEPNMEDGQLNGFRFTMIKEGSLYQKAGIQNDDIVKEVNGVSLVDTAQTIKLLNSLRGESNIEMKIIRAGNIQTINLQVR